MQSGFPSPSSLSSRAHGHPVFVKVTGLPSHSSENLRVFLDSTLSFKFHIQSIKKFCRLLLDVPLLSTPHASGSQTSACLRITCWLLKTKRLRDSDSGSSGWGLKFAFLTKSSENAAGPGPYFENHHPVILWATYQVSPLCFTWNTGTVSEFGSRVFLSFHFMDILVFSDFLGLKKKFPSSIWENSSLESLTP